MANPFLTMGEPPAPFTVDASNPFMTAEPIAADVFSGENPFADGNPFSNFGESYEPPAGDTVPMDIFGPPDPTESAVPPVKPTDLDLDEPKRPRRPPPPPARPLPPETRHLITAVTDHMDFASSHLLDRIPPTRTPSPVSVRDLRSPSPVSSRDLQTARSPSPDEGPTRPPRPPPPRPAPPADDVNLFEAPAHVTIKPTKEDILSLYAAPKKEERPIDFLSDDIVNDAPVTAYENETDYDVAPMEAAEFSTNNTVDDIVMDFSPSTVPVFERPSAVRFSETEECSYVSSPFGKSSVDTPSSQPLIAENSPFAQTVPTSPFSELPVRPPSFSEPSAEPSPFADIPAEKSSTVGSARDIIEDQTETLNSAEPSTETSPFADRPPDAGAPATSFARDDLAKREGPDTFGNPFGDLPPSFDAHADASVQSPFANATLPEFSGDAAEPMALDSAFPLGEDAFDAFSAKFDSTVSVPRHRLTDDGAWGGAEASSESADVEASGFEAEAFDPFLSMGAPPPPCTPRLAAQTSQDSADDTFSLYIRPKESEQNGAGTTAVAPPVLAPPPRAPLPLAALPPPHTEPPDESPPAHDALARDHPHSGGDTPPTPLFDDDVSVPLEEFPRVHYHGDGWEMYLRQPNKKKITGQRFWKKVFVRLAHQGDNPVVQLRNQASDKEPFQELPLQACYSVSEIGAQQFDQFGKIFTAKLQYVFYKERPGVRPGQVTKAERITTKLTQFAAYAIQGDYQGVKEFGSDLRKLGLPVEHAPQVSQLFKLGSLSYEDVKQFSCCVEEALFRLPAHRDRALVYKTEEVQVTAVDELYVEQDADGAVQRQVARVRLFFLGFLGGMPDVELGVNDLRRQGREVVGRHDIIPVVTEEWIRVENQEFHACVQPSEFEATKIIKFKPPDACYIELMRFRVRPPKNRELPLQLKAAWCVTGNKVELRADVLVPGFASRSLGQVPCEDVSIRFPIPECWIYLFRVEKHFRYGSVKSAHRRTGKIKGIERFLGAVDTLQESLIEVTSGQAKYEHQHRAIVWRMPRLPKEGQGAYTTHNMVCRMALTSYDQVPAELARWALVEFTMPATQVSHVTVRSISLQQHDNDPPEKYVRYLARHEYRVGIERTTGQSAAAYVSAAAVTVTAPPAVTPPAPAPAPAPPSSDSESD